MKKEMLRLVLGLCFLAWVPCALAQAPAQAQISPLKLKVSMRSKSDTKETYRSADGRYRNNEMNKSVYYSIDLTNISSGPAKDLVVKWAVLVKSNGGSRVVKGEKSFSLEFAKTSNFDTDVIELSGQEWIRQGSRRTTYGAKIVGYAVEVFCNDQKIAADIKPTDVKEMIDQVSGSGDQKRHAF